MTYLQLLTQLTAQLKHVPEAQAEQTWREVLTRYAVLPTALEDAPALMVKEAGGNIGKRTSLEIVTVQVLLNADCPLYFGDIQKIVAETLQAA